MILNGVAFNKNLWPTFSLCNKWHSFIFWLQFSVLASSVSPEYNPEFMDVKNYISWHRFHASLLLFQKKNQTIFYRKAGRLREGIKALKSKLQAKFTAYNVEADSMNAWLNTRELLVDFIIRLLFLVVRLNIHEYNTIDYRRQQIAWKANPIPSYYNFLSAIELLFL
jgi:hypothetical protein